MRRSLVIAVAVSALSTALAQAEEPTLPSTAKMATREEFIAFVNGKTVDVVIYDAGKSLTAILKWDWKKKRISGSYVLDGQKGKVQAKWTFEGDKVCSQSGGRPKECHGVYIEDDKFYEMRDDGKVHAISKLKS
jgi:hypothetical protein